MKVNFKLYPKHYYLSFWEKSTRISGKISRFRETWPRAMGNNLSFFGPESLKFTKLNLLQMATEKIEKEMKRLSLAIVLLTTLLIAIVVFLLIFVF